MVAATAVLDPRVPNCLSAATSVPWSVRVRRWREDRNISQQQVAAAAGVSRGMVAEWEAGRRAPRHEERLVESFRAAQEGVGEKPGRDTLEQVRSLWRAK